MNISDFMSKLVIEKNSDATYSYTGRKDHQPPQGDLVEIDRQGKSQIPVPQSKRNQSYT